MSYARSEALREFLDALGSAFAAAIGSAEVSRVAEKVFAILKRAAPSGPAPSPGRLAACIHLHHALQSAQSASPELARPASAFAHIEPSQKWVARTTSGPFASDNWPDGHANSTIIGPNGIEVRDDVWTGVSLLAPHVRYPDHRHPPEEIDLVMTPGRFRHGDSGWFEPGPGGTLHNIPDIDHAMASGATPLLAFCCLPLKP